MKRTKLERLTKLVYSLHFAAPEIALLHDLNSDHDRRHLDAGLSRGLEFYLKRVAGDIKLSLHENKRLNHNAPMHDFLRRSDGKAKMMKKKHIPLEVIIN